jgi:hypothetical protein
MTRPRRPHAYRFEAINLFCRTTTAAERLSPTDVAVWVVIWTAVDVRRDGLARVSYGQLAKWTGWSVRTLKRAVARLKARRLLVVVNAGRGRQVNVYRPWPRPPTTG